MRNTAQVAAETQTNINPSSDPEIIKFVSSNGGIIDPGAINHYSSGVRAALSFQPACNPWLFSLRGTYFHTKNNVSSSQAPPSSFDNFEYTLPAWNPASMGTVVLGVNGSWKVELVTADLIASRSFSLCNIVCLSPLFGLRAAWLKQKLQADYYDPFFSTPGATLEAPFTQSTGDTRYAAGGLISGLEFETPLFKRVNLIGSINGSLLYGNVQSNLKIHGFHAEPNPNVPGEFILGALDGMFKRPLWALRANVEMEFGFIYKCLRKLELGATYFFSLWFDQNDIINFIYTSPTIPIAAQPHPIFLEKSSNLQLNGLVVKLRTKF